MVQATPDTLTLRAEATDEENLQRIKDLVARHLERFGRRDHLKVNWHRPQAPTVAPGGATSAASVPTGKAAARRGHLRTIVIIAAGVLAVAVHLGLGGAVLVASRWTGRAADIVLVVVLMKVITIAGHIVLGSLAIRRRKASTAPNEK